MLGDLMLDHHLRRLVHISLRVIIAIRTAPPCNSKQVEVRVIDVPFLGQDDAAINVLLGVGAQRSVRFEVPRVGFL